MNTVNSSQRTILSLSIVIITALTLALATIKPSRTRGQGANTVTTVSAASYEPVLAPEAIAAAFGSRLATKLEVATGLPLPTNLAGTTVKVNGEPAGLFFVSPTQVNYLIPANTAPGAAQVIVASGDGTVSTGTVQIAQAAPSLFTANSNGQGVAAAVALRVKANGMQVFEPVARLIPMQNLFVPEPIKLDAAGEQVFLILYGGGIRRAPDPNRDGNVNESVRVVIGGNEITPAYAGPAPGFAGLDQINVELPRTLIERGVVGLSLTAAGFSASNPAIIEIATPPGGDNSPRVTGFGPSPALAGATLIITGSNFDPAKEKNLALIAGVETRQVDQASETQLSVKTPFGAVSGKVAVRTSKGQGESVTDLKMRTSISGYVETTTGQPVPGMIVRVIDVNPVINATTDNQGAFVLIDVPPAAARTVEIAPPSGPVPLPFPVVTFKKKVEADRDNHADRRPLQQVQLTGQNALPFGSPGTPAASVFSARSNVILDSAALARTIQDGGIAFEVPDDATAVFPGGGPGGATTGAIFLNLVERSRTPVELPPGVFSSTIAQLTPFGVKLTPGGKLTFPNNDNLPRSSSPRLYRLDQTPQSPTLGQFIDAGEAEVSPDGQRIETELNAVVETSMFLVAVPQPATTVIGRVVENDRVTPVRGAIARANGQEATTDGNGGFTLRNVPVTTATLTVEATFQRPSGRVDRVEKSGITVTLNSVTKAGDLVFPPPPPNRLPVIVAPASLEVTEGLALDAGILAFDQDANQTVRVNLSGPGFASLTATGGNNYTLRLSPQRGDARTHTLTITATDNENGVTMQTIRLTVNANRAPALTAPALRFATPTQPLSFIISATDLDNTPPGLVARQTFDFSVANSPPGATLVLQEDERSARFSWTPSETLNSTPRFTVTDNGSPPLSDSKSTTIVVGLPWTQTGGIEAAQTFALLFANSSLFAATTGGVFVFINEAQSWSARNNGLTTLHVNTLIRSGQTLLAGTNGGGVFRSTDLSQNWGSCGKLPNQVVRALATTSNVGDAIFAGTFGGGVFRSPDGCQSWTAVNSGLANQKINALAVSGSTIYAGTEDGGVFCSTNNGQSWQAVNQMLTNLKVRALAFSGRTLLAGTDGGGVFCLPDGGAIWANCSAGLTNLTINAIAVNGADAFACTSGDGVFRTTNQGGSWTSLAKDGLKNPFVSSFAVGAVGSLNEYFAGTAGGGVFRSNNQGQSWTPLNRRLATSTVNSLIAAGANPVNLYAGTAGGGVFRSIDQGQNWIADNNGLTAPYVNAFVVSAGTLFAATNGGVFSAALSANPLSWTPNNMGLPDARYTIALAVMGEALYAGIAPEGGVYRSDDQGQSWRQVNAGITDKNIQSLAALGSTILAGTENGGVFRSTNGGQSWTALNTGLTGLRVHALTASGGNFYAGTNNGVHSLPEQGQSWTQINSGLPPNAFVNALLVNGSKIYAGIFGGLYFSNDQGQNWAAANTGLTHINVFALTASGANLFAGTIGGGVYLNPSLGANQP